MVGIPEFGLEAVAIDYFTFIQHVTHQHYVKFESVFFKKVKIVTFGVIDAALFFVVVFFHIVVVF